jgi:hypothetical protein
LIQRNKRSFDPNRLATGAKRFEDCMSLIE